VLVVDDDAVLLDVLGRVLTGAGHRVLPATTVHDALLQAELAPDVALLDLNLPDGNGLDLARALRARQPDLRLVLMTACPPPLGAGTEAAGIFACMLTKPVGLTELHEALALALTENAMSEPTPPVQPDAIHVPSPAAASQPPAPPAGEGQPVPPPAEPVAPAPMPQVAVDPQPADHRSRFSRFMGVAGLLLMFVTAVVFFLGFIFEVPVPFLSASHGPRRTAAPAPLGVKLVEGKSHTLEVPPVVAESLGIRPKGKAERLEAAKKPTRTRPLVLPGSTALDATKLMRIRARFAPAEVVSIGEREEDVIQDGSPKKVKRELRTGDWVEKDQELGVFYSVDVGSKKNDLIDGIVQLRLDQEILDRAQKARSGAIPEVFLLTYRRNVESDRNAIARAWNTLKTWGISEKEIRAVEDEGEEIAKRKGKRYDRKEDFARWARVVLKAPDSGFLVERNVTKHEIVVDPTINLFQVAKVDRLTVVANAPEEELPTLLKLRPKQRVWTIRTMSSGMEEGIEGPIDEISYLIDVNQHAALVKGHIDNPKPELEIDAKKNHRRLRAGQYITATIELPPPDDVVEVPMSAILDDGKQCLVFVQDKVKKNQYTMRRVEVTHRFATTAFVKSKLTAKQQKLTPEEKEDGLLPRRPLALGERVLTSGALELKKELEDLLAKEKK
jgi:cobalt-zinc-cadmium efflux system membrane fusion protein